MAQVFGYPYEHLPRISRRDAARATVIARWVGAWRDGDGARVAALLGAPVEARFSGSGSGSDDAARAIVRVGGAAFEVCGSAMLARRIAQRVLGGPEELPAARSLDATEEALWAVAVAAALEDLGAPGDVVPAVDGEPRAQAFCDAFAIDVATGELRGTVVVRAPRELELRAPPARTLAPWTAVELEVSVVLGRCALPREAVRDLCVRDLVTLEPPRGGRAELVLGEGAIGLAAMPGAVEAEVVTGYGARDMALPDDAHVELTVALGTTRMSLRALTELAIGQIVPLGRPLAGPFELRVEGRAIGRGELVDVDGELGVRVVGLGDKLQ